MKPTTYKITVPITDTIRLVIQRKDNRIRVETQECKTWLFITSWNDVSYIEFVIVAPYHGTRPAYPKCNHVQSAYRCYYEEIWPENLFNIGDRIKDMKDNILSSLSEREKSIEATSMAFDSIKLGL